MRELGVLLVVITRRHPHQLRIQRGAKTIEESPVSSVIKGRLRGDIRQAEPRLYAIKSASTRLEFSKKPHDILKELRVLLSLTHPNTIEVVGHGWEAHTSAVYFWMSFVPYDLLGLLSSPNFSPHEAPLLSESRITHNRASLFVIIAKSIAFQVLQGIAYLHDRRIAHRDIKPRNILLDEHGCAKIIDFGIAWTDVEDLARDQFWPEPPGKMVFDVSTGPYRAPELLFGAHTYDAFAIDLWSLGAVFGEFLTPLRLERRFDSFDSPEPGSDSDEDEAEVPKEAFTVPRGLDPLHPDVEWARENLFDAGMGTIGLAWSIFKIMGTPNEELWPEFNELPDANKVTFRAAAPASLETLLPNLPFTEPSRGACLELVQNFLRYSPCKRIRAAEALHSRCFSQGLPLLLPPGYPLTGLPHPITQWSGQSLGAHLSSMLIRTTHA